MPSEHGEIRWDRADMLEDVQKLAEVLRHNGRVSFHYAAFGTLHVLIGIESQHLLLGSAGQALWAGGVFGMPPGVHDPREENSHTLWVRQNSNEGRSAWLANGGYHVPGYVAEKFCERANPTDGLGLGILFLLLEHYRWDATDDEQLDRTIKQWVEQSPERDLPAFMTKGESQDG